MMADQPHVLLITADHWPGALLGAAGHRVIQTPTLDRLAECGTRFSNAYSECPVCIPARRTLLTGTTPQTHGDRVFTPELVMPPLPTMADVFHQAGYQAIAVGKLHVYPPRARAGFDEVILSEEGRPQLGPTDDYEIYLGDQGLAGRQFLHGMSNNDYVCRPWHLSEEHHVTNWTTRQMARMIQRRDPTRPGFWYLSYTHPHPPLVPPQVYWDMYQAVEPEVPYHGTWECDAETMPGRMNSRLVPSRMYDADLIRTARRAFYALCTHIDHQIRIVLGTLREEGILDDTVIMFLADHGDMLGNHGLWAKRLYYEDSACVPMLLVGARGDRRVHVNTVDDRLVGLQDVMPTLLHLAGVEIPETVDGVSMVGPTKRESLYGEYGELAEATRMLHNGRFKLIYYAYGNRLQLFDLHTDPEERHDLSQSSEHQPICSELTQQLLAELYGNDCQWAGEDRLVGLPLSQTPECPDRSLSLQRGSHWPIPPQSK